MWILPEQLEAILDEHGVRCDAAGPGPAGELRLGLAVEPAAGAVRIEARAMGGATEGTGSPPPAQGQVVARAVDVDVRYGLWDTHVRELLAGAAWRDWSVPAAALVPRLWAAFCAYEMLFLDVALAPAGAEVRARGLRAYCDDNALFRNERAARLLAAVASAPAHVLRAHGIEYVELDGTIAILSVGAGETMAVMDLLDAAGEPAACFLDVSGGLGVEAVTAALRQVAALPRARAVLVNVFGGLTRVDRLAESLLEAIDRLGFALPLVVRLEGTLAERGRERVASRGLASRPVLREAIETAVALAREAR